MCENVYKNLLINENIARLTISFALSLAGISIFFLMLYLLNTANPFKAKRQQLHQNRKRTLAWVDKLILFYFFAGFLSFILNVLVDSAKLNQSKKNKAEHIIFLLADNSDKKDPGVAAMIAPSRRAQTKEKVGAQIKEKVDQDRKRSQEQKLRKLINDATTRAPIRKNSSASSSRDSLSLTSDYLNSNSALSSRRASLTSAELSSRRASLTSENSTSAYNRRMQPFSRVSTGALSTGASSSQSENQSKLENSPEVIGSAGLAMLRRVGQPAPIKSIAEHTESGYESESPRTPDKSSKKLENNEEEKRWSPAVSINLAEHIENIIASYYPPLPCKPKEKENLEETNIETATQPNHNATSSFSKDSERIRTKRQPPTGGNLEPVLGPVSEHKPCELGLPDNLPNTIQSPSDFSMSESPKTIEQKTSYQQPKPAKLRIRNTNQLKANKPLSIGRSSTSSTENSNVESGNSSQSSRTRRTLRHDMSADLKTTHNSHSIASKTLEDQLMQMINDSASSQRPQKNANNTTINKGKNAGFWQKIANTIPENRFFRLHEHEPINPIKVFEKLKTNLDAPIGRICSEDYDADKTEDSFENKLVQTYTRNISRNTSYTHNNSNFTCMIRLRNLKIPLIERLEQFLIINNIEKDMQDLINYENQTRKTLENLKKLGKVDEEILKSLSMKELLSGFDEALKEINKYPADHARNQRNYRECKNVIPIPHRSVYLLVGPYINQDHTCDKDRPCITTMEDCRKAIQLKLTNLEDYYYVMCTPYIVRI